MEALLAIALLLVLAAPAGLAAAWFSSRGPEALSSLFGPDRGLGWPRGVQEEEPVAWNWDRRPPAPARPGAVEQLSQDDWRSPVVQRVVFRMGGGSARRGGHDRRRPVPR